MSPLKDGKATPGDRVKAEVVRDLIVGGKVVVPRKAKLLGHVTVVTRRSKTNPSSRLGFVFDRVEIAGHSAVLPLVLGAVAPAELAQPVASCSEYATDCFLGQCSVVCSGSVEFRDTEIDPLFDKYRVRSTGCEAPVIYSSGKIKLGWYAQLSLIAAGDNGLLASLPLRVGTKVDTINAKSGDPVVATLSSDAALTSALTLRQGTRLLGRVVKVAAWKPGLPASFLEIAFDNIVSSAGEQTAFAGLVFQAWPESRDSGVRFRFSVGPEPSGRFTDDDLLFQRVPPAESIASPELILAVHGENITLNDGANITLHICKPAGT
jgi:hypothetical protein